MSFNRARLFACGVAAAIVPGGCAQVPDRIEGAAGGPRYAVDASWRQHASQSLISTLPRSSPGRVQQGICSVPTLSLRLG